jgi:hypothetical protein
VAARFSCKARSGLPGDELAGARRRIGIHLVVNMNCTERLLKTAAVLLVAVALPAAADADPILLSGGTVQVDVGINSARITFIGDGFLIRTATDGFKTAIGLNAPFPAGTPIELGGVWHPTDFHGGEAIVNGVHYSNIVFGGGQSGGTFSTQSVVLSGLGQQTVTLPFTFDGFVSAFQTSDPQPGELPLFSASLVGSGKARAAFMGLPPEGDIPALYSPIELPGKDFQLEYTFAPTPEPGTLALLTLSSFGFFAVRRRAGTPRIFP